MTRAVTYADFLAGKRIVSAPLGAIGDFTLGAHLFPFQRDIVAWALRRGRAAIFADTGLGKSRCEIEWSRIVAQHTGKPVLVLTPLAVARQMVDEGASIGVGVKLCREAADVASGINVTNYDRLHKFDPAMFGGIALDESSIIKHHDASTLAALMLAFGSTPYRLCATATPAPNDYTELGTHAEFLGVCTRLEMLSEFFVHDSSDTQRWRLKGHAQEVFWQWVASWGAVVRHPRDLGYDTQGYDLPPLHVEQHVIAADHAQAHAAGALFAFKAQTMSERRDARRGSIAHRVAKCAEMVNTSTEQWLVWCDLNDESGALAKAIPDAIEVRGSDDHDVKEQRLMSFARGESRVLVSKPRIAGWGLNLQRCNRIAFVGVTDSWEAYYQAIRRCWRFGQRSPVYVHVFVSELEGNVVANLQRKEADALAMTAAVSAATREAVAKNIVDGANTMTAHAPHTRATFPAWMGA